MHRHPFRSVAAIGAVTFATALPSVSAASEPTEPAPTYDLKVKLVGDDLEFGAFNRIAACRVECIGDSAGDDSDTLKIGVSPSGEPLAQGEAWVPTQASTTSGAMRGPVAAGDWRIAVDVKINGERIIGYVTGGGPRYISATFTDALIIPVVDADVAYPDVPITYVEPEEPKLPKMPGSVTMKDDYVLNDKFYFSMWRGSRLPEGARVIATMALCEGKKIVRKAVGASGKVTFDVEGFVPKMARQTTIKVVTKHPDYRRGVAIARPLFDDKRYEPGC